MVVEDDPAFNTHLCKQLRSLGKVDRVTTLAGAFTHVAERETPYDIVVLDRSLPDGDGTELITLLKKDFPSTIVCILSGWSEELHQAAGLKLGADLYLCKPLSAQCASDHVKAIWKRDHPETTHSIEWNDLCFFPTYRVLRRNNSETRLTNREAQCLELFLRSRQGEVTQDQISKAMSETQQVNLSTIHVTIQRLRRKIKHLGLRIQSQYGTGYILSF